MDAIYNLARRDLLHLARQVLKQEFNIVSLSDSGDVEGQPLSFVSVHRRWFEGILKQMDIRQWQRFVLEQ
eukprot:CAMPEP_0168851462 /NCGR_PEP_ID=MMETSP0727-20121128/12426_1 /TAXON_ID=265536 /ORGANISM="Amphiprora sp., Strain CCMP467" /LENGTH=69 /DNA_ID=CAMNT_0008905459 /DNA_START=83 /DNA_END=289 /DNA_ORIENTATION=+